ncbi:hypothetical protein MSG28_005960, partial [Choristoneura fumiferana]
MLVILGTLLSLVAAATYFVLTHKYNFWKKYGLPSPKPLPLLGNYADFILMRKNLGDTFTEICKQFPNEPIIGTYYGTEPAVIIKDPELLKLVITKDFYYFSSRELREHVHREPATKNVFSAEGDYWRVMRQNLTPVFSSAKMKKMFYLIEKRTEEYQKVLAKEINEKQIHDARSFNTRFTMDCIGSCIFGVDTNAMSSAANENPFRIISDKILDFSPKKLSKVILRSMRFAKMQMLAGLVTLLKDYTVELPATTPRKLTFTPNAFTTQTREQLALKFLPRRNDKPSKYIVTNLGRLRSFIERTGIGSNSPTIMLSVILCGVLGLLAAAYYYLYRKNTVLERKRPAAYRSFTCRWKLLEYITGEQSLGDVCVKICHQFPKEPIIGTVYGTEPAVIVKDPEILKIVFTKDFYYFNSREQAAHTHKELTFRNVFSEAGDRWRVLRQNLTPLFSSSKMKAMFHLIELNTKMYAKLLEEETKVSLVQDIKELNLRNNQPGARNDFIDYLLTFKSKDYIEGDAMASMKSKELNGSKIQIKVTHDMLAAQSLVFFAAGFETSSTTMTFSLFELAKHQDVQQRVYEELTKYLKKTEGKVTYEVTSELPYMEACVDEALRLYPVLGTLTREVVEDYTLPNGVKLEKGVRVFIPTHYMHKNPDYWPEPLKYDPERFFGDNKHTPYTYFPFGEGMRIPVSTIYKKEWLWKKPKSSARVPIPVAPSRRRDSVASSVGAASVRRLIARQPPKIPKPVVQRFTLLCVASGFCATALLPFTAFAGAEAGAIPLAIMHTVAALVAPFSPLILQKTGTRVVIAVAHVLVCILLTAHTAATPLSVLLPLYGACGFALSPMSLALYASATTLAQAAGDECRRKIVLRRALRALRAAQDLGLVCGSLLLGVALLIWPDDMSPMSQFTPVPTNATVPGWPPPEEYFPDEEYEEQTCGAAGCPDVQSLSGTALTSDGRRALVALWVLLALVALALGMYGATSAPAPPPDARSIIKDPRALLSFPMGLFIGLQQGFIYTSYIKALAAATLSMAAARGRRGALAAGGAAAHASLMLALLRWRAARTDLALPALLCARTQIVALATALAAALAGQTALEMRLRRSEGPRH